MYFNVYLSPIRRNAERADIWLNAQITFKINQKNVVVCIEYSIFKNDSEFFFPFV